MQAGAAPGPEADVLATKERAAEMRSIVLASVIGTAVE